MATFTETEISDLCEILETNSDALAKHLVYYASIITDSDKLKVLDRISDWASAGSNFTAIMPMEANFGAKINPNDSKAQIKRQIAALLNCTDLINGSSRLIRG